MIKKTEERILWTKHSREKMKFYGLSESRLRRILRSPQRIEEGIALKTIAIMQRAGSKKRPTEIWLMYQLGDRVSKYKKIKIISAWRYPGVSPINKPILIPKDTLRELKNL